MANGVYIPPPPKRADLSQMSPHEIWYGALTGRWPVAAPPQSEVARMGLGHGRGQNWMLSPEMAAVEVAQARAMAGVLPASPGARATTSPGEPSVNAGFEDSYPPVKSARARNPSPDRTADEHLTLAQVRERLKRMRAELPHGTMGPFGELCGFKRKYAAKSMAKIVKGKLVPYPATLRRLSRSINEHERGELAYQATGQRLGGVDEYRWVRQQRPRAAPPSINARKD